MDIVNVSELNIKLSSSKSHLSTLYNMSMWKDGYGATKDYKFTDPVSFYFRPFFYFDSSAGDTPGARLLGLDVDFKTLSNEYVGNPALNINSLGFGDGYLYAGKRVKNGGSPSSGETGNDVSNSAINFLLQNGEYERAEKLLQFIKLLSEISTYEPWTFQQISGLDEALNRSYITNGTFKLEEERKSIKIKCLQEGYNSRIGTLMDLYRDVCYSYRWKKEIIPANLRKFDMGIYIFTRPIRRFHSNKDLPAKYSLPKTNYNIKPNTSSSYHTSVKYIELLNCEFDYNSNISTYADIDASEGKYMENEIKIFYDECYEMRYNEFMMRTIGDQIFQDTDFESKIGYFQTDNNTAKTQLKSMLPGVDDNVATIKNELLSSRNNIVGKKLSNPILTNFRNIMGLQVPTGNYVAAILDQNIRNVLNPIKNRFKTINLGNLSGTTTNNGVYSMVGDLLNGNINGVVDTARRTVANGIKDKINNKLGNIGSLAELANRTTSQWGDMIGNRMDNIANSVNNKINEISLGNLVDKSLTPQIENIKETIKSNLRGDSPISNNEEKISEKKLPRSEVITEKRGFVKTSLKS